MKQAQVLTERDKQRVMSHVAKGSYPARNRAMLMLSWQATIVTSYITCQ
jgi:hypothetical protein